MAGRVKGVRANVGRSPVRLTGPAHEQAREILAFVSRNGWASLAIDREDPPTLTAVLEEAIRALRERMHLQQNPRKEKR